MGKREDSVIGNFRIEISDHDSQRVLKTCLCFTTKKKTAKKGVLNRIPKKKEHHLCLQQKGIVIKTRHEKEQCLQPCTPPSLQVVKACLAPLLKRGDRG